MKIVKYGRFRFSGRSGFFALCALLLAVSLNTALQAQVGAWRAHFAATPPQQLALWGQEVYASRVADILCYNTADNTLTSISKRHGLSGGEIGSIAYHAAANALIVGYKDGNIDLYYGDWVYNMSDIKDKTISGGNDKTIYRIFTQGPYAYLACGFGIVILDVMKREFKETYFIGPLSSSLRTNEVSCDEQYIWAATEQGLRFANKKAINLNDHAAWTLDKFFGDQRDIARAVKIGQTWWVLEKGKDGAADRVYRGRLGEAWQMEDTTDIKKVTSLSADPRCVIRGTYSSLSGKWSIDLLSENGELLHRAPVNKSAYYAVTNDAVLDPQQNLWAVGSWETILRYDQKGGEPKSFYMGGPAFNTAQTITGKGDRIYVASGGYDASYTPIYRDGSMCVFDGVNWRFLNAHNIEGYGNFSAMTQILEDPKEEGHYFLASAVSGLMEVRNNKVIHHFTELNSPLQSVVGTVRVYGIALDSDGDLWMTNAYSSTALLEYRHDGTWKAYDISEYTSGVRVGDIMVDYWQHIWVLDSRDNLYVFEATGDSIRGLQIDENNGSSVSTGRINCMMEDDLGHVWLGTERGIKRIETHKKVFDNPNGRFSSVECKNIMVPSGDFIIELLHNDAVKSMVYDGGNRKWIGTESNGVFLVSADGTQELAHYTAENSDLLSNRIETLGMIPYTGEVFMVTQGGICSYMGTGSFREEGTPAVPFPNPVPPLYEGYISIRNLPQDAEVKITDAAGHLIYEGRATGSQLSWNGFNMQGKRPQSGVLLVFAATSDGGERMVCKIFYTR